MIQVENFEALIVLINEIKHKPFFVDQFRPDIGVICDIFYRQCFISRESEHWVYS